MGIAGSAIDLIRTVFARDMTLPYPATLGPDSQAIAGYQNSAIGPQSEHNSFMAGNVAIEQNLMARYADYEEMSQFPEIGAAFDLLADDATIQDVLTGKSIWFESPDKNIEKILNDMLNFNLRMEEDIRDIARGLVQYGNGFEEIIVMDGLGVVKLNNLNTPAVRRIEDKNGMLYGFVHDEQMAFSISTPDFLRKLIEKSSVDTMQALGMGDGISVYEPWEVVHFRMRGMSRKDMYGASAAESARWVWKRLTMMEDAMVLYKLTRSPQRLVFYVDVGDAPPNQARAMLQKIKMDFKKQKYVNDQGKLDLRYSPLSSDEDLFIGTRKGKKSSEVEVLSGPEGQQIEDVNYFRDKLFTALKIPKSYLGMDETVGHHNLCLVPETKIPLLDGRVVTIEEMIREHDSGKENWVYSIGDDHGVVPGRVINAQWTRKNADVVRVTLDNGEHIDCTPDHPFMLRDGQFAQAKDLSVGQSLMPYYERISEGNLKGYQQVYSPRNDKYEFVHRIVADCFHDRVPLSVVHHVDCKKLAQSRGIRYKHELFGLGYSQCLIDRVLRDSKISWSAFTLKFLNRNPREFRRKFISDIVDVASLPNHRTIRKRNHKVVSVEVLSGVRDTCDIEIEHHHNFATAAGVFVHNSQLDVRHAKSVMRIQRELKNGVAQVGRVDLSARNIDPDKVDYACKMVIPSGTMEAAQMEVMAAKMDLGGKYRDAQFSEYFIWSEILGLSDETIQRIRKDRAVELGEDEVKESVSRKTSDSLTSEKKFFGVNSGTKDVTNKIRDEIAEGRSDFAKRMRELKGLMQEVQHSIKGIGRKRRD